MTEETWQNVKITNVQMILSLLARTVALRKGVILDMTSFAMLDLCPRSNIFVYTVKKNAGILEIKSADVGHK